MKKNQKSKRNNIEDFLCPFTDMYITQGANGSFSHKGTMANDVIGKKSGYRYPYYAPCSCRCLKVYPSGGGSMWQSLEKVRFSNGRVDFATFIIYHDESQDCKVGQVIEQGHQIGNMGKKGNATGVHCHIEIEQGADTTFKQNKYGVYCLNNEYDTDDCYFMDDTNILNMKSANWKYLKDVPVNPEPQPTKRNYTCLYDMYVRTGAGTNHSVKLVKDLSADGKKHATSSNPNAYAIYKKGTVFTALEIVNQNGIWAKTPSGYVCIKGQSGKVYCE